MNTGEKVIIAGGLLSIAALIIWIIFLVGGFHDRFDINRDWNVTLTDFVLVKTVALGTPATDEMTHRCDVNRDGLVNDLDVELVRNYLLEVE